MKQILKTVKLIEMSTDGFTSIEDLLQYLNNDEEALQKFKADYCGRRAEDEDVVKKANELIAYGDTPVLDEYKGQADWRKSDWGKKNLADFSGDM